MLGGRAALWRQHERIKAHKVPPTPSLCETGGYAGRPAAPPALLTVCRRHVYRRRQRGRPSPTAWDAHEAAAEEIEVRPATHLALEHFEAIDVGFDRPRAPGQCDPGFDGGIVVAQPSGKALERPQRTAGRPGEPGIELGRLPVANEVCKALRQPWRHTDRTAATACTS